MVRPVILRAVGFRRVFREAAPAAADLEHALARLQVDLLREAFVFAQLRGGQIVAALVEQGRRIGHRRVEPGPVEIVAEIVMRVDVLSRLPLGVAVEPVAEHLRPAHQRLAAQDRLHHLDIDAEQIEEFGEVRRFPFAAQIGFRDADIAAAQQAPRETDNRARSSWPRVRLRRLRTEVCVRPATALRSNRAACRTRSTAQAGRSAAGRQRPAPRFQASLELRPSWRNHLDVSGTIPSVRRACINSHFGLWLRARLQSCAFEPKPGRLKMDRPDHLQCYERQRQECRN